MTKPRKTKAKNGEKAVTIKGDAGETEAATMSRVMVAPYLRHGVVQNDLAKSMVGGLPGEPNFDDFGHAIKAKAKAASEGDIEPISNLLTAQALTLDAMFTELIRRSVMNFGDYPLAAERYARLAFKAQANSRAALEALAKLHQPREQVVRHVHVNEGGQAVVADHFHHHGGNLKNEKTDEQPHATGAAGECAPLPSPDPQGNGMPLSSSEGQATMQNARGKGQRGT